MQSVYRDQRRGSPDFPLRRSNRFHDFPIFRPCVRHRHFHDFPTIRLNYNERDIADWNQRFCNRRADRNMDSAQKKDLREQYRQMKPAMGVFAVRNIRSNRCFLEASADIPSMFNRIRFQLDMGMHPNRALQQDWKEQGADAFTFETIDRLEYSNDAAKTDYREDLKTLKSLWRDRLAGEGRLSFYP